MAATGRRGWMPPLGLLALDSLCAHGPGLLATLGYTRSEDVPRLRIAAHQPRGEFPRLSFYNLQSRGLDRLPDVLHVVRVRALFCQRVSSRARSTLRRIYRKHQKPPGSQDCCTTLQHTVKVAEVQGQQRSGDHVKVGSLVCRQVALYVILHHRVEDLPGGCLAKHAWAEIDANERLGVVPEPRGSQPGAAAQIENPERARDPGQHAIVVHFLHTWWKFCKLRTIEHFPNDAPHDSWRRVDPLSHHAVERSGVDVVKKAEEVLLRSPRRDISCFRRLPSQRGEHVHCLGHILLASIRYCTLQCFDGLIEILELHMSLRQIQLHVPQGGVNFQRLLIRFNGILRLQQVHIRVAQGCQRVGIVGSVVRGAEVSKALNCVLASAFVLLLAALHTLLRQV
mmetsp:Transcript_5861/g.22799  ORF Transcript_5861/g.22799 Transcript_5861/m.22799 type:complete len:396 (+) Transcript_5861:218-1405(+)